MTKALYDGGRQGFLSGDIDWDADDIRAILVDLGQYTVDLANHVYLSSVPAGARVSTSESFTNKTTTAGIADADDAIFYGVTGATVEAVIIYQHTGVDATSRLIAYLDSNVIGLPLTPSGADVQLNWNDGTNRIFKL